MKYLIILLIIAMPLIANGQEILATEADTANWTLSDLSLSATTTNWAMDSLMVSDFWYGESGCVKHDTTKEYVKEVADKCDTTWGKHWVKYKKIDGEQYFKRMARVDSVYCYIDTVWADKQAVYLTPKEMKRLRKLID